MPSIHYVMHSFMRLGIQLFFNPSSYSIWCERIVLGSNTIIFINMFKNEIIPYNLLKLRYIIFKLFHKSTYTLFNMHKKQH